MVKYRLSPSRTWIELSPWIVVVVPRDHSDPSEKRLEKPCDVRVNFFHQYTNTPPRAAFETTVGELREWLARGRGVRKNTDRQRILGGIFDRACLREGLSEIGIHLTHKHCKVRIEAHRSPTHPPDNHVLVVRLGKAVCCVMCCREGTVVGVDRLPIGRAA